MPEKAGEGTALRSLACQLLFWLTAITGLTADLATKEAAFRRLGWPSERAAVSEGPRCEAEAHPPSNPHYEIIPCWFRFHTSLNPGGIWGKFDGGGTWLAVFSVLAMGLVGWWFAVTPQS